MGASARYRRTQRCRPLRWYLIFGWGHRPNPPRRARARQAHPIHRSGSSSAHVRRRIAARTCRGVAARSLRSPPGRLRLAHSSQGYQGTPGKGCQGRCRVDSVPFPFPPRGWVRIRRKSTQARPPICRESSLHAGITITLPCLRKATRPPGLVAFSVLSPVSFHRRHTWPPVHARWWVRGAKGTQFL